MLLAIEACLRSNLRILWHFVLVSRYKIKADGNGELRLRDTLLEMFWENSFLDKT